MCQCARPVPAVHHVFGVCGPALWTLVFRSWLGAYLTAEVLSSGICPLTTLKACVTMTPMPRIAASHRQASCGVVYGALAGTPMARLVERLDGRKNMKGFTIGFIVLWLVSALVSLTVTGVIIWAIVKLVLHFAG